MVNPRGPDVWGPDGEVPARGELVAVRTAAGEVSVAVVETAGRAGS